MSFSSDFLEGLVEILRQLDLATVERAVELLAETRARQGRLFIIGVGGSAANAAHAVNDFRKLCGFEAYAPTDNVSELTARTNDEGWEGVFASWLTTSRLNERDALLVLSVGGGDETRRVSVNIVEAVKLARQRGATVVGIVGREAGYTAQHANACVVIPEVRPNLLTPYAEAMQGVVWHLMVSHPRLKTGATKW